VERRLPSKRGDDDGFAASSEPDQPAATTHSSAPNEQPKRNNFDYGARARSGRRRQMRKLASIKTDVIHNVTDEMQTPCDSDDSEQGRSVAPSEEWEPWLQTDEQKASNTNYVTAGATPTNIPVNIYGTPQLQARIRQICETHTTAFRRDLVREPARVSPLKSKSIRQFGTVRKTRCPHDHNHD
jgi:hypothetical protein